MFCTVCGSKLENSQKFCTKCGSKNLYFIENNNQISFVNNENQNKLNNIIPDKYSSQEFYNIKKDWDGYTEETVKGGKYCMENIVVPTKAEKSYYLVRNNQYGTIKNISVGKPQNGIDYNVICPFCGNLLGDDPDHCPNCGIVFSKNKLPIIRPIDNINNVSHCLQNIKGNEFEYDADNNGVPDIKERDIFLDKMRDKNLNEKNK